MPAADDFKEQLVGEHARNCLKTVKSFHTHTEDVKVDLVTVPNI